MPSLYNLLARVCQLFPLEPQTPSLNCLIASQLLCEPSYSSHWWLDAPGHITLQVIHQLGGGLWALQEKQEEQLHC